LSIDLYRKLDAPEGGGVLNERFRIVFKESLDGDPIVIGSIVSLREEISHRFEWCFLSPPKDDDLFKGVSLIAPVGHAIVKLREEKVQARKERSNEALWVPAALLIEFHRWKLFASGRFRLSCRDKTTGAKVEVDLFCDGEGRAYQFLPRDEIGLRNELQGIRVHHTHIFDEKTAITEDNWSKINDLEELCVFYIRSYPNLWKGRRIGADRTMNVDDVISTTAP
jgi:hypothetical protein